MTLPSLRLTRFTDSLCAAISLLSDSSVCLIEHVTVLAMRFLSVAFELGHRGVVEILGMRDQLEVLRADTRRVDAAVVDFHPSGNRTVGEGVRKPMRQPGLVGISEMPIPRGKSPAIPRPAIAGTIDLRPEPLLKRPNYLFRPVVRQRVSVALPAPVVHLTPSAPLGRFQTSIDRALHVSIVDPCPTRGNN